MNPNPSQYFSVNNLSLRFFAQRGGNQNRHFRDLRQHPPVSAAARRSRASNLTESVTRRGDCFGGLTQLSRPLSLHTPPRNDKCTCRHAKPFLVLISRAEEL